MRCENRVHAIRLAALAVPACLVFALVTTAQDTKTKSKNVGTKADSAAGGPTYDGRLLSVRPEARRVVFQVRDGESWRVFNMPLADQARVQMNGQAVGLATLKANSMVRVSTRKQDGLQKVVTISTGGEQSAGGTGTQQTAARSKALDGEPTGGKVSLAYPTGDRNTSVLLVESNAPDEVRVGQAYDYKLKVTNISKNLMLENVRVTQVLGSPVESSAGGKGGKAKPAGRNKGDDGNAEQARSPDAPQGQNDRQVRWTVPVLGPGESATLRAQSVAHEEGVVGACFRVTYQPALCVRIQAVKPELEITKEAPDTARLCGALSYKYTVKNTGSAVAKGVTITEQLPEGLTIEGKSNLAVVVGDLKPGQSVSHTAKVHAANRGSYASRATARSDGGLVVQSRRTTTRVQEADLAVDITGPQQTYATQPATYTVTVKNEGDAPAPGTTLNLKLDPQARFVKATAARKPQPAGGKGENQAGAGPRPGEDNTLAWNLGDLAPGETRKVTVTVTGRSKATLKHTAIARFVCDVAQDQQEQDIAVARGVIQAEVLVIPALRLSLVDQSDLIQVGSTVTYTLRIVNQGTGPDENLKVKLDLPENLQFVDAVGPTNAQADGQSISLGTVKELAPGQTISWNIRAKAMREGDVRTTAELDSEYLDSPVSTTEPTRLVK